MSLSFECTGFLANWLDNRSEYFADNVISIAERQGDALLAECASALPANDNDFEEILRRG